MATSRRDWQYCTGFNELQSVVCLSNAFLETLHAAGCFVAISLSFVVYGVLQERMMTVGFGEKQDRFIWSLFIVFCNRLLTCSIALGLQLIQRRSILPVAPIMSYAAVSFGNLVASTCQYDSLKYITFAMQTLAKCCKMLPVMLWGFLIGRQRYSATELATASAVMAGCAAFIFSGNILNTVDDEKKSRFAVVGIVLLVMYLVFDGFTSTWQDRLFKGFEMDTGNQVLYTTLCSSLLSFVVLICSGEMMEAGAFLKQHPQAWVYITAVSSVATIFQYFVSYTIRVYGALNFATLMTARQFLSIIASCIIYDHHFTIGQWLGTLVVFAALSLRMSDKHRAQAERERHGRKDTPGDTPNSKGAFLPQKVTIPAVDLPDDGYSSSTTGDARYPQAFSNRRSPGNWEILHSQDHTLATHPVGPHRSSESGKGISDRSPLLSA